MKLIFYEASDRMVYVGECEKELQQSAFLHDSRGFAE